MAGQGQDSSSSWGNFLGAGIGDLAQYLGNKSATNSLVQGNQNAIDTQQATRDQLTGIYGSQRELGTGADSALGAQLGLYGTPNYAAFMNSPGFQSSLALGNQAIERAAAANGSLYTPNMLNALGQYDTTYASQNYNNYIGQLLQSAGLGAQGNANLGQNIYGTGANISQLQQNQGVNKAGGAANATGIATGLLSKVPWGQLGSQVSNWWNGDSGSNFDTSSLYSQDDQYLNNTDFSGLGDNSNP